MEVWRQYKGKIKKVEIQEVDRFIEYTKEIEVDTETTGFDPYLDKILCVQLGSPEVQYLIPWCDEIKDRLKPLFLRTDKTFLFQNAKFDLKFFYSHELWFNNNIYDTFLAESVIACGLDFIRKSLDVLADRYLKVDISKAIRGDISRLGLTREVIEYGLNDVRYLTLIKNEQTKIIQKNNLTNALRLENSFVRALAYIEYSGIGFDREAWVTKTNEDRRKLTEIEKMLNQAVIDMGDQRFITYGDLFSGEEFACKINWNSPKHTIPFFESLGLNLWVEEKGKKKKSTDQKVLIPQKGKHPIVSLYLEHSKYTKRVSTFGESYFKFIHTETGRIHTSYKQVMNTGRLSCGNARQTPPTPNLQQIPNDNPHRHCFISKKGNKLIASDYTGQENVVFANKCLDPALLDFYDKGVGDEHSLIAKMCYPKETEGLDLIEIKDEKPELRNKAKAAGFAIKFGGNGFTISNNLSIPKDEGTEIYEAYMKGFPEVARYFKEVSEISMERGYMLFNEITNRRSYIDFFKEFQASVEDIKKVNWAEYRKEKAIDSVYYNEVLKPRVQKYFRKHGDIYRTALNYPIQGTAADITKTATCIILNRIMKEGWMNIVKLVHLVHDEILVECPDDMADMVSSIVKEAMETAGALFYTRVPLKAVPAVGDVWIH